MSEYKAVVVGSKQERNGKFSVSMDMVRLAAEGEVAYVSGTVTSAAVFDTDVAAVDGGYRAVKAFEATGSFPNMCEPF